MRVGRGSERQMGNQERGRGDRQRGEREWG